MHATWQRSECLPMKTQSQFSLPMIQCAKSHCRKDFYMSLGWWGPVKTDIHEKLVQKAQLTIRYILKV